MIADPGVTDASQRLLARRLEEKGLELEIRVGRYRQGGTFVAGLAAEEGPFVRQLMQALRRRCQQDPGRWQDLGRAQYVRTTFDNGLRSTAEDEGTPAEWCRKTRLETSGALVRNRGADLRLALSREEEVAAPAPQRSAGRAAVHQRASFREVVDLGDERTAALRFDVTKTTTADDATRYHLELELERGPEERGKDPTEDIEARRRQLASAMLQRACHMLGSRSNGERLAPAELASFSQ